MEKNNIDEEILKILEEDCRIPLSDMSKMLDIDEKEIKERIEDLKNRKVIRKFTTSIDWKKMGRPGSSAIIQVKVVPQQREGFSKVCKDMSKDPRVKDLYVATGEYDAIMLVEGKNIDEISEFVTEKLAPKKEIVGTYTLIVLQEYKKDGVAMFEEKSKRLQISM